MIALFKGGETISVSIYRPISNLPLISRIIEKLSNNRLYVNLEKSNIIHPNQFSFRKEVNKEQERAYLTSIKNLFIKFTELQRFFRHH